MLANIDFLLDRFRAAADKVAFIDSDEQFSYSWILGQTLEYEKYFHEKEIKPGQVVAIVADYSPHVFCFLLAAITRGLIIAPLTREAVAEHKAILDIAECQWLIEFDCEVNDMTAIFYDRVPVNPILADFVARGEPGLLLFSSGSTGEPKAILHDFGLMLKKFETPRPSVVAICFLMLDHFGGINTLFHIVSNVGTVVTIKQRSVAAICEAIESHKVELLPATPSFLNVLVHSDAPVRYDLSSLKIVSYGTEVMPQATLDRLRERFPNVKLQQTYGLSELGVLRSKSHPDGTLWVKIGGEGFQTRVVDGVLWIKSDYAMVGYLNAPSPFDSDGWFNTQDQVEVDGEYFKILGRTTDLINVGGQKVYPSEIEDVIIGLDNVADVAVSAEPNALLGNIVVAKIALKSPEDEVILRKRIRKACATVLAPYKVPSKVITADDLYSRRMKKVRG